MGAEFSTWKTTAQETFWIRSFGQAFNLENNKSSAKIWGPSLIKTGPNLHRHWREELFVATKISQRSSQDVSHETSQGKDVSRQIRARWLKTENMILICQLMPKITCIDDLCNLFLWIFNIKNYSKTTLKNDTILMIYVISKRNGLD